MEASDYKRAIEAAREESTSLLRQRVAIDARLNQLKKTIEGLSALLEETPEADNSWLAAVEGAIGITADSGITDAIRTVLRTWNGPLTPIQLRERLQSEGFPINDYASGMTVIHNTLKRLERQGEITLIRGADGTSIFYTLPVVKPRPHAGREG